MEDTNIVISDKYCLCYINIVFIFSKPFLLFLDNLFLIFILKYKHLNLVCTLLSH